MKSLKSWFVEFMPFTYRLIEEAESRTIMQIDLTPTGVTGVNQTKFELMTYIQQHYKPDEWFKAADLHQAVKDFVNLRQLQRYLTAFVTNKKLRVRGGAKNIEDALIGFYDLEQETP